MHSQIGKLSLKVHDRFTLLRYIRPFVKKNKGRVISKENTLCLFCQPRGGSTWLAEILLHIPNSALIDEPLWRGKVSEPFQTPDYYCRKVRQISDLNFFYNQHIPESSKWPEAKTIYNEILTGQVSSIGLYDEQDLGNLKNGDFYITKFNYANLLMPWLINQFNFNSLLLTRHPCAVIASQLKHSSWQGIDPLKANISGDIPYKEYYQLALKKVGGINSREKYLALIWALGFKNTAMHVDNNKKWLTISYEGLLTNFHHEIMRINHRFSLALNIEMIDYKKPSKSTKPRSIKYLQNDEQLSSWKKELTKKQISTIVDVLDKFEIDIYSEKLEPKYDLLYRNDKKP